MKLEKVFAMHKSIAAAYNAPMREYWAVLADVNSIAIHEKLGHLHERELQEAMAREFPITLPRDVRGLIDINLMTQTKQQALLNVTQLAIYQNVVTEMLGGDDSCADYAPNGLKMAIAAMYPDGYDEINYSLNYSNVDEEEHEILYPIAEEYEEEHQSFFDQDCTPWFWGIISRQSDEITETEIMTPPIISNWPAALIDLEPSVQIPIEKANDELVMIAERLGLPDPTPGVHPNWAAAWAGRDTPNVIARHRVLDYLLALN